MDIKKIEKNLTNFSDIIIKKIEEEIEVLDSKSAKTKFDKEMNQRIKG